MFDKVTITKSMFTLLEQAFMYSYGLNTQIMAALGEENASYLGRFHDQHYLLSRKRLQGTTLCGGYYFIGNYRAKRLCKYAVR